MSHGQSITYPCFSPLTSPRNRRTASIFLPLHFSATFPPLEFPILLILLILSKNVSGVFDRTSRIKRIQRTPASRDPQSSIFNPPVSILNRRSSRSSSLNQS